MKHLRIVVGFVGMWIPRSGIQVIVGSIAKSQVLCMLFHDGVISTKPFVVWVRTLWFEGEQRASLRSLLGIMGFTSDSTSWF